MQWNTPSTDFVEWRRSREDFTARGASEQAGQAVLFKVVLVLLRERLCRVNRVCGEESV